MEIDCKERVAFDLMNLILGSAESGAANDRATILDLYNECLTAVRGHRGGKSACVSPLMGR